MMIINNLPAKYKALLDIVWEMEETEQVVEFVKSLPYRDMISMANLLRIANDGGDEVDDVSLAKQELDRIAHL